MNYTIKEVRIGGQIQYYIRDEQGNDVGMAFDKQLALKFVASENMYEALLSALGSLTVLGIKDKSWGDGIIDTIQKALNKAEGKEKN
jgi:ribosome assembly protein YihI (activator of Der GTPase)